jgi:replicative DNA helicase
LPEAARARAAAAIQHYDGDAEAAVLSAVVLETRALDEVRDILEPEDFFSGAHRTLYEAVIELDLASSKIDTVTLMHRLASKGLLQQVGGSAFLAAITDATPSVANVVEHAKIVRRLSLLRRMGRVVSDLSVQAKLVATRGDVSGFLEKCEREVFAVGADAGERDTGSLLHDMMASTIAKIDPSRPREPRGVTTGFYDLDQITTFVPGELWYVAARPGVGKTSLALGMAQAVSGTGRHAAFFSMEMKRPELSERLLSMASGVAHDAIQSRQLSMAQYEKCTAAAVELGRHPLIFDDLASLTPGKLRSRVRHHAGLLRSHHPHARLAVVVVDYVQLMTDDSREGNRNDQLERISRALKILAGEFGCTVIALSQLKRPEKSAIHLRPTLNDLRGSGALEQDADKVVLIHRDRGEDENEERGEAELHLAKSRNTRTGKVRVTWQPWCSRFVNRDQAGFAWQQTAEDRLDGEARS